MNVKCLKTITTYILIYMYNGTKLADNFHGVLGFMADTIVTDVHIHMHNRTTVGMADQL